MGNKNGEKVNIGEMTLKLDLDTTDADKKLLELEKRVETIVEKLKSARDI